jgi:hypothetical protein
MDKKINLIPIILLSMIFTSCAVQRKIIRPEEKFLRISKVRVEPKTLDFSKNTSVSISFNLNKTASTNIKILDYGHRLIDTIVTDKKLSAGAHAFTWNGKDTAGNSVSDGVYLYTIEAVDKDSRIIYNPYQKTYGKQLDIGAINYDKQNKQISFVLPKIAMMRLRTGLKDGLLLNTLFDWRAEPAGRKVYFWDGKDDSGYINFANHPDLLIYVSAYSLADNSIIVKNSPSPRQNYPLTPMPASGNYLHAYHQKDICHEPKFKIEFLKDFLKNDKGYPIVNGKVPLRISIDEGERHLIDERFEIILFVDTVFLFEDEDATTPFNYYWDVKGLNPGEHVLTVNLAGYQDHIGTKTIKVEVQK